jgi:hypothetical protein
MMRPLCVTTNAVVSASGLAKAASTAALTFSMSTPVGAGVFGSRSPIGQSCEAAGGRFGFTAFGVKLSVVDPSGYVTHPWLPVYTAVRTTPFGSVMLTVFFAMSTTGLPTFERCS